MFKKTERNSHLEATIEAVHARMADVQMDSEEYDRLTTQLSKLYKLREHDSKQTVSPDTLVLAGANLLGIMMIVGHERTHVVTSKALSFVSKLK